MEKIKLNWFEIFSLTWIIVNILILLTILLGIFNFPLFSITILTGLFIPFYGYKKKLFQIEKTGKSLKILTLVVFLITFSSSILTTPTIFGGRDEGSYSNSAIIMAEQDKNLQNNKLIENFFDIYGESKALNFPGFKYNKEGSLESQFLPGYSSWLAIFYKSFGTSGLKFANLIPFITLILAFYLLIIEVFPFIKNPPDKKSCLTGNFLKKCWLKLNQAEQFGWLGAILMLSFMPMLVFYKFTLSEIYFASLLWFAIYLLIRYLKNKNFLSFKIIFLPLLLMLFVRIETIAIIFALLLIMIGKDYNHLKQARYKFFFAFSGFILLIAIWLKPDFFIDSIKGLIDASSLKENFSQNSSGIMKTIIPNDWRNFYVLKLWFNYNLLPFFIMAFVFLTIFFKTVFKQRKFGKEKALIVIPFLLVSPTLIYLIDANITLDHPWMLRRWIFSIIPVIIFYSILFLFYLKQKNQFLFRLIVIFLIIGNLSLFFIPVNKSNNQLSNNFFTLSQNQNLIEQTYELSQIFSKKDLILLSQNSSGSGWSLIADPMRNIFDRQAVYFFNPKDYYKLDKSDFNNIYLIVSKEEESLYKNLSKEKIADKIIRNTLIKPSKNPLEKTQIIKAETKINIYKITE